MPGEMRQTKIQMTYFDSVEICFNTSPLMNPLQYKSTAELVPTLGCLCK